LSEIQKGEANAFFSRTLPNFARLVIKSRLRDFCPWSREKESFGVPGATELEEIDLADDSQVNFARESGAGSIHEKVGCLCGASRTLASMVEAQDQVDVSMRCTLRPATFAEIELFVLQYDMASQTWKTFDEALQFIVPGMSELIANAETAPENQLFQQMKEQFLQAATYDDMKNRLHASLRYVPPDTRIVARYLFRDRLLDMVIEKWRNEGGYEDIKDHKEPIFGMQLPYGFAENLDYREKETKSYYRYTTCTFLHQSADWDTLIITVDPCPDDAVTFPTGEPCFEARSEIRVRSISAVDDLGKWIGRADTGSMTVFEVESIPLVDKIILARDRLLTKPSLLPRHLTAGDGTYLHYYSKSFPKLLSDLKVGDNVWSVKALPDLWTHFPMTMVFQRGERLFAWSSEGAGYAVEGISRSAYLDDDGIFDTNNRYEFFAVPTGLLDRGFVYVSNTEMMAGAMGNSSNVSSHDANVTTGPVTIANVRDLYNGQGPPDAAVSGQEMFQVDGGVFDLDLDAFRLCSHTTYWTEYLIECQLNLCILAESMIGTGIDLVTKFGDFITVRRNRLTMYDREPGAPTKDLNFRGGAAIHPFVSRYVAAPPGDATQRAETEDQYIEVVKDLDRWVQRTIPDLGETYVELWGSFFGEPFGSDRQTRICQPSLQSSSAAGAAHLVALGVTEEAFLAGEGVDGGYNPPIPTYDTTLMPRTRSLGSSSLTSSLPGFSSSYVDTETFRLPTEERTQQTEYRNDRSKMRRVYRKMPTKQIVIQNLDFRGETVSRRASTDAGVPEAVGSPSQVRETWRDFRWGEEFMSFERKPVNVIRPDAKSVLPTKGKRAMLIPYD
jgi:hypothetical protein